MCEARRCGAGVGSCPDKTSYKRLFFGYLRALCGEVAPNRRCIKDICELTRVGFMYIFRGPAVKRFLEDQVIAIFLVLGENFLFVCCKETFVSYTFCRFV